MTDRLELVRWFNAVEERSRPYDIRLDGAPIWPLLRVTSGYRHLLPEMASSIPVTRMGTIERLSLVGKAMTQWASLIDRPASPPLLFFSNKTYQSITGQGTVDKFAHPLMYAAAAIERSSVLLVRDRPLNGAIVVPPRAKVKQIDAVLHVRDMWHWQKSRTPLRSIAQMGSVPDDLTAAFGEPVVRYLDKAIHNFRQHLAFARYTLRRIRPSHVFVTCWYTVENMAMAHACQETRIPCIDLQHGVQGPAHLAYGAWKALPTDGCSTIPSFFWCWDEASARNIRSWAPSGHHEAFVGGSPWLEQDDHEGTVASASGEVVLYTLQPVDRPLPDDLTTAIRNDPYERHWVFRLHPNAPQHRELITSWAEQAGIIDRVSLEDPRVTPLQLSLRRAALHITLFSSVILEASYLGVPSIALHPNAAVLFPDLLNGPHLELASGMEHLVELLTKPSTTTRNMEAKRSVTQNLEELLRISSRHIHMRA